jgi:hypothetical protein
MAIESASERDLVRGVVLGYDQGHEALRTELETLGVLSGRRFVSLADEYGGYLVAKALGGRKTDPRRVVVEGNHGITLQVCTAQRTPMRRPKYFPLDCPPDDASFDAAALVIFESDWTVFDSYLMLRSDLGRLAVPGKKRQGFRLPIGGSWRSDPAVLPLSLGG